MIRLVYLEARDFYQIEREYKAGIGYVDFIFYPLKKEDDCIILELKVDHSAEEAIQRIKDRGYALRFEGKLGEKNNIPAAYLQLALLTAKRIKNIAVK